MLVERKQHINNRAAEQSRPRSDEAEMRGILLAYAATLRRGVTLRCKVITPCRFLSRQRDASPIFPHRTPIVIRIKVYTLDALKRRYDDETLFRVA
jgi:hypothetical protein